MVSYHVTTLTFIISAIAIVMVEGEGEQVDETTFCEAVILGLESVSNLWEPYVSVLCNCSSHLKLTDNK